MFSHIAFCVAWVLASAGCSREAVERRVPVDASEIQDIRVDYEHSGWGTIEEHYMLAPATDGADFVLRASYFDGRKKQEDVEQGVPAPQVEKLVAMASAPAWPREIGVRAVAATVERAPISELQPSFRTPPFPCTAQELQRLARLYVRREGVASLVDEHYGRGMSWTDDYPFVLLQIRFRDGSALRRYSNSQKAMMLPWYRGDPIESPPESDQDWSLPFSQALRAVLPSRSGLYARLGGDDLPHHLNSQASYQAGKECDAMRSAMPDP